MSRPLEKPDWKALAPQAPPSSLATQYVQRPGSGGLRIAERMLAGCETALLAGPVGIGKSTELMLVGAGLDPANGVVVPLPLDLSFNMRQVEPASVVGAAARLMATGAALRGVRISDELQSRLQPVTRFVPGGLAAPPDPDLARLVVREVQRLAPDRPITLLIDGLEKTPAALARPIFDALAAIEGVNLVAVISWQMTFGPEAAEVIRPGEKLFVLHPIEVEGDEGADGRRFFREILQRRLGLADDFFAATDGARADAAGVVDAAARLSGGVPRTFLQLVGDAAAYAHVRRGAAWPDASDLASAAADQRDSLRRLLLPGDEKAVRAVEGTDGREMELDRKIRLLSHGIVLEHDGSAVVGPVMRAHPLAREFL